MRGPRLKMNFLAMSLATLLWPIATLGQTIVLVTEWKVPTTNSAPLGAAVDSTGAVYFAESNKIGRLNPQTNSFSEWQLPSTSFGQVEVVVAPSGEVFFNEGLNKIAKLNPTTNVLTEWDVSSATGSSSISVFDLALDISTPSSPLLWVSMGADKVGRLNPLTNAFRVYSLPLGAPRAIAVDAGGVVWLGSEFPLIMRLDPGTGQVKRYVNYPFPVFAFPPGGPVPSAGAFELGLRIDVQGRPVFAEFIANKLGRVDPVSNTVTEYAVPTSNSVPFGIALGSQLAFTEFQGNKIGTLNISAAVGVSTTVSPQVATATFSDTSITPTTATLSKVTTTVGPSVTPVTGAVSGAFEEFTIPTAQSFPRGIAFSQGNIFFAESTVFSFGFPPSALGGNKIGRISGPQPAIQSLGGAVTNLVNSGVVNQGQGTALLAKLQAAIAQANRGNATAAINQLQAFINQVNALINVGILSQAQGQPLIDAANAIISQLSSGGP